MALIATTSATASATTFAFTSAASAASAASAGDPIGPGPIGIGADPLPMSESVFGADFSIAALTVVGTDGSAATVATLADLVLASAAFLLAAGERRREQTSQH